MRTLCKFKSTSNIQVLFVFRQISGALASEQVPRRQQFTWLFLWNKLYSNPDTPGSGTKKPLQYNEPVVCQRRPSVICHEIQWHLRKLLMMSSSRAPDLHSILFPSRFFSSASALGQLLAPMSCLARIGISLEGADICSGRIRKSGTSDNSFPSKGELSELGPQTCDLLLLHGISFTVPWLIL